MRIWILLEHLSGKGGVETVVTAVSQHFSRMGHEVIIWLPDPSDDTLWESHCARVCYYSASLTSDMSSLEVVVQKSIALAQQAILRGLPDLIVATHVPHTTLYARLAIGYNSEIPIISWLHNPPSRFHDPHLINYADIHWAISKGIASEVQSILKPPRPVIWIGNPVDAAVGPISFSAKSRFLFIGRLENAQKRVDVLLKGFQRVEGDWELDIYGTGPDEATLRSLAQDLLIHDRVKWHGWVSSVWDRISSATALVLTSDFEGMPMIIGEALARGLPVISTDCHAGPAEMIRHGENGWLTPTGDSRTLADVLSHVMQLKEPDWSRYSRQARESVGPYHIEQVAGRMIHSLEPSVSDERLAIRG